MTDSPTSSAGGVTRPRDDDEAGSDFGGGDGKTKPPRKRKRASDGDQKHLCSWEGCNKSFSRIDHLTRHALNHAPTTIYKCPQCTKVFVRNDLLIRHVERHTKRETALAEGGSIRPMPQRAASTVAPEPARSVPPKPSPLAAATALSAAPVPAPVADTSWHDQQALQQAFYSFDHQTPATQRFAFDASTNGYPQANGTPVASTSTSKLPGSDSQRTTEQPGYASSHVIPSFRTDAPSPFDATALSGSYFDADPLSSSHSTSALPGLEEPLHFIQASYGAPFVSAQEYSWLFDASRNFDVTLGSSRPASPGHEDFEGLDFGMGLSSGDMLFGFAESSGLDASAFETPVQQKWVDHEEAVEGTNPGEEAEPATVGASAVPLQNGLAAVEDEVPVSETPEDQDPSTFVEATSRARILDYLGPEWIGLRADDRMSTNSMSNYLQLFWTRVHETQAPAIHRASFRTSAAPTPLLLSMMLLGCYFAEKEAHALAIKLHPMFRGKVFCSTDFRPRAEIWLHQTALLIIVFGKLCSNRMAHEMSHIFWSSVVTCMRRSGLMSQRLVDIPPESRADVDVLWRAWIEEEVAKRVAHIGFATDVQHAALFRHSPALSAFQIQLTLPCDEDEWEAPNATEWARIHARSRPPIPFISALKASLMAGASPPALNPFSRITILHGLLSVAQDLQRDHVIGLSQSEGRSVNWRDLCSGAYNNWKARLDTTLETATYQTSQLLRASISLYAVAHITLSIDIHELQIFAGAENALGLVVSPVVYEATTHRIRIWSASKDGRAATWHAAFFLRSSLQHWFESTGDLAGCLHHRWAVYIACLTLYCFGKTTSGPQGPREKDHREATMRYLDSMCTDTPEGLLAVPHKNNTASLCETICEYIQGSRWEIAQEGARILAKLRPAESPTASP